MRNFLMTASLALAVTTVVAFGADNSLGTWKLNVEKSKYAPAPLPAKALTVVREASDGGAKVTITGELASGTPINANYTTKYDGSVSTISGSGTPFDTISVKQVDANSYTDVRKKTGTKYHATSRTVISGGGKTMSTTTKGVDADGKGFSSTLVFEKQ
jgi:hypothetical protein